MRILHVSAGNLFGGVETLLVTLARCRNLCPAMEPEFALCFEGKVAQALSQASVPIHLLGPARASRPWTIWRGRRELATLLRRLKMDVVICHSAWPHAVFGPVVRRASIPLVTWIHDPARGTHWVERWARPTRPDFVVCNSRFTAGSLKNIFPGVPFEVIYCLVAATRDWFHDRAKDRAKIRAELDTPENAVVVIQVSRLERWKGHLLHLEALGRLRQQSGWMAWIVGGAQRPDEVDYLKELKNRAAELEIADRIRFLGHRSDVSCLLSAADIHCQPNTGPEPFGITFVEGLHAGLPIVTTALGGAMEIVDDKCGLLVPTNDPPALAECLLRLVLDASLRSRLGSAGPKRARLLCDPRRQMAILYDCLTAVVGANKLFTLAATPSRV